jgi:hypothetical protein
VDNWLYIVRSYISLVLRLHSFRSPLAPLKKGRTGFKAPLKKGRTGFKAPLKKGEAESKSPFLRGI